MSLDKTDDVVSTDEWLNVSTELGFTSSEIDIVETAARDAHMEPAQYCRLMVLCAAGCGGVAEHVERVFAASAAAEREPPLVLPKGWTLEKVSAFNRLTAAQIRAFDAKPKRSPAAKRSARRAR